MSVFLHLRSLQRPHSAAVIKLRDLKHTRALYVVLKCVVYRAGARCVVGDAGEVPRTQFVTFGEGEIIIELLSLLESKRSV